jgi:hypothetical protein
MFVDISVKAKFPRGELKTFLLAPPYAASLMPKPFRKNGHKPAVGFTRSCFVYEVRSPVLNLDSYHVGLPGSGLG